ncbi:MAG: hypothetical protein OEZ01_06245 [Candidatus Heimdallarchaeota archaeon]|nr:hypothetical protein [Candidatus Heimdallarchaeota archaeon]MDH5645588.1 hypothetical protein [Candidatus Heimdallarchaeota archaeon]
MAEAETIVTEEIEFFEVDGKKYVSNPDFDTFMKDAFGGSKSYTRYVNALKKVNITTTSTLFVMFKSDLEDIEGISKSVAVKIYNHAQLVKRKGKVVLDYDGIKTREGEHVYLPTGSASLDKMMTYADSSVGWRSRTLIELYGEPSKGKTQICYTAASIMMRAKDKGGWGRGVFYIDSEGAFEGKRFESLVKYWGVDPKFLKDNFLYSRVSTFDDVEAAISEGADQIKEKNIGLIVLDSIMDPLKSQYVIGGENLNNLPARQRHLKKVVDLLKSLADIHNLIVIYTNHVRAEIGAAKGSPAVGPQGGAVLGHASDIRIRLDNATKSEREELKMDKTRWDKMKDLGIKLQRAKIVDCGFLGNNTGFFIIGPMGIGDPDRIDEIIEQTENIFNSGYMSITSTGAKIASPKKDKNFISRDDKIQMNQKSLYG